MLKLVKVPIYRILVHVVLEQYSLEYPRYRSVRSALTTAAMFVRLAHRVMQGANVRVAHCVL